MRVLSVVARRKAPCFCVNARKVLNSTRRENALISTSVLSRLRNATSSARTRRVDTSARAVKIIRIPTQNIAGLKVRIFLDRLIVSTLW